MRLAFAIVVLGALLTACNKAPKPEALSADTKLSQMVVGSWATPNGIIEIDADGSSTATFTNGEHVVFYQTDWKITDGCLVVRIDNVVANNTNHEPIGSIERMKITTLNSTDLEWHQTNGIDGRLKRLK